MKLNEKELKSLLAEKIWEALEKARAEDGSASDYEIVCEDEEIFIKRAEVYYNFHAIVRAEEMADLEEIDDKAGIEEWLEKVMDPPTLREIMLKLKTIEETESMEELQGKADVTEWLELSDEKAHNSMIEMLEHGISLLKWNLDTVEANCSELNEIAEKNCGWISAGFYDSREGGPLPRKESDEFILRADGLDLCGLKYGTNYNDDGEYVLNRIARAMRLPEPAWRVYEEGWHEDTWNLADIEK